MSRVMDLDRAQKEADRKLRREWLAWKAYCDLKEEQICQCEAPVGTAVLSRMIRRLAGINPRKRLKATRNEFSDALSGKSGSKGCGPASWDNAVRAIEEDR